MPRRGENVYHRKDGLWEARYVKEIDASGKKKYGSVYGHSCREVKEKRQQILDQILLYQKPLATRNITVAQLVEEWLRVNSTRIKPTTLQRYKSLYKNHIEKQLAKQPVLYFTTPVISDFSAKCLDSGLAPQSVNAVLVFLHSCLKYGHQQYRLPLPEIVYLSCPKKEMRVLTVEEQQRLVDYLQEDIDIYKFGVLLALYTGLRIGELCALQWADISEDRIKVQRTVQRISRNDSKGTELYIGPPKTNTSFREIPIPSFLIDLINRFREKGENSDYVLGTTAKPIAEPRTIQYKFKRYVAAAQIAPTNFHALRHSFATRCVECDFELKTLSAVLGHSSARITLDRYVHSSFELKATNMEKLTSFW